MSTHVCRAAEREDEEFLRRKVKGQRSRDKSKVKGQVVPPGGYVMNQCRHLADMSYTRGALLRTSRELVVTKFVRLIFCKVAPSGG